MASRNPLLQLMCVMAVAVVVDSGEVKAGGNDGWNYGKSFPPVTISTGSSILFSYEPGTHNVIPVSKNDYQQCSYSSSSPVYSSGNDYVTLNTPGYYYFICGYAGHCTDGGMRISVTVT